MEEAKEQARKRIKDRVGIVAYVNVDKAWDEGFNLGWDEGWLQGYQAAQDDTRSACDRAYLTYMRSPEGGFGDHWSTEVLLGLGAHATWKAAWEASAHAEEASRDREG